MSAYSINLHLVIRSKLAIDRESGRGEKQGMQKLHVLPSSTMAYRATVVVSWLIAADKEIPRRETHDTKREIIESRGRREMKELSERVLSRQGKPRIIDMQRQFALDNCASR